MRTKSVSLIGCLFICGAAGFASAPAFAGLVNPTSTVDITFNFVNSTPMSDPSGIFDTAAPGPFSPPIHTTEPYNLSAQTGFFFTDAQVVIYNNASPSILFQQREHGLKLRRSL